MSKKIIILLVTGLFLISSVSCAEFFIGIESNFALGGGVDSETSLIELSIPMVQGGVGGISLGGKYTKLIGKVYKGNIGKDGTFTVHWGVFGGIRFASAGGYSISIFDGGPALVEHLRISKIKFLFTQTTGIFYSSGVSTEYGVIGSGIGFEGIGIGAYYEF